MSFHTSSLINIKKNLNRPIIKFYNGHEVNVIAAELPLTKTRSTSFYKKFNLYKKINHTSRCKESFEN